MVGAFGSRYPRSEVPALSVSPRQRECLLQHTGASRIASLQDGCGGSHDVHRLFEAEDGGRQTLTDRCRAFLVGQYGLQHGGASFFLFLAQ